MRGAIAERRHGQAARQENRFNYRRRRYLPQ